MQKYPKNQTISRTLHTRLYISALSQQRGKTHFKILGCSYFPIIISKNGIYIFFFSFGPFYHFFGNKEVVTSEQGDWCLLSSDLRNFYQQINANYQICKGIFPTKEPTPCGHVSLYFPCTRTCVLLCLEGTQICFRSMNDGWWGPIKGIDLMTAMWAVQHSLEGVWVLLSFTICIYFCVELIFTAIPLLGQLLHFHLQIIFAWLKYNINLLDQ